MKTTNKSLGKVKSSYTIPPAQPMQQQVKAAEEPEMSKIFNTLSYLTSKVHGNANVLSGIANSMKYFGENAPESSTGTETVESGIIPTLFSELKSLSIAIDRQDAAIAHLQTIIG